MSGIRFNDGKPNVTLITARTWIRIIEKMSVRGRKIASPVIDFLYFDEDVDFLSIMSENPMGCAKVLTFGTKKYAAHNWANGLSWVECCESLLRHLIKLEFGGETHDEESGLPHMDHIDCNLMFMEHFSCDLDKYSKFDDRKSRIMSV